MHQCRISAALHQRSRKSSSLTAVVLNLPSSGRMYVLDFFDDFVLYPLTGCQGDWLATGLDSNTPFTGISLEDGEWFDYDEKAGAEVSIKDLKWNIARA